MSRVWLRPELFPVHWGPPRACYRVPYCDVNMGTPVCSPDFPISVTVCVSHFNINDPTQGPQVKAKMNRHSERDGGYPLGGGKRPVVKVCSAYPCLFFFIFTGG